MIKFSIFTFLVGMLSSQASFALYTPQKALKDALSEPLTYMGKFIPSTSESGLYPDCVFRNSKVIVISSYCVKRDIPAGRLFILPAKASEGHVRLYAEISGGKDISEATRDEYLEDFHYTAVIRPQKLHDLGMTFEQIKYWSENETSDYSRMCVAANSQKAQPNSTNCKGMPTVAAKDWSKAAYRFLTVSDPNFARLLRQIKSQVP